jgi:hypothetical protein
MSLAPEHAEIVRELTEYIIGFVEQPHPKLGNLPVCPFARRARLENRIRFEVRALTEDAVLDLVPLFEAEPELHMIICIHPNNDGISADAVSRIVRKLNETLPAKNLMAVGAHPVDPFSIDGLYTRREPYPNIQLLRLDVGVRAAESLKNTSYYDRWTEDNMRDVTVSVDSSHSDR